MNNIEIEYDTMEYCASVRNGKVEYYAEYYKNMRIVYTLKLSYREYVSATEQI